MASVCVAVITRNEEGNIEACLEASRWADELVVLDSLSTDRTSELARSFTSKVYQREFTNFAEQRNAALELVDSDWVFFVDADERISSALASEIRAVVGSGRVAADSPVGFWVPRENLIWGKVIRHGGWHPDHQLRLLRRGYAFYDLTHEVHEVVRLDGASGYLRNPLLHLNYNSVRQFNCKQRLYSNMQARSMWRAGVRPKWRNFVLQPMREFWRRFWQLRGCLDGWRGLVLSSLLAYYTLYTYLALHSLWRCNRVPSKAEGKSTSDPLAG